MGPAFLNRYPIEPRSGEARSDEPRSIKPRPTVPKTKKPQNHNKKREVAAAVVIQRWRRGLVEAREAAVRANEIAADRRWAVRKLHRAYANRWRFVLAARKRRRLQWEEEVGLWDRPAHYLVHI